MMLAFNRKRATVAASSFNPAEFLEDLVRAGFDPIIYNFKKGVLEKLGLGQDEDTLNMLLPAKSDSLLMGEVFFPEQGICCYVKITRTAEVAAEAPAADEGEMDEEDIFADPGATTSTSTKQMLVEVGELAPIGGSEGQQLAELQSAVEGNISARFEWQDAVVKNKKLKGRSVETPSEKEIELASILRDPRLGNLLKSLRDKDAIVVDEFLGSVEDAEEVEYFIDKLFEVEFLSEEIVVYDDETGMPIIRAKDRAALKQLAAAGIRSPGGKPIEDLIVKRMAAVTKDSKLKMSPAWVAGIFLTNSLFKIGMTNKDITILESDNTGSLSYCNFDGVSVLFYISDNVHNEKLNEACEAALDMIEHVHIIVFSENEISEDFVTEFQMFTAVDKVSTIENLDSMAQNLAELLEQIRQQAAKNALEEINPMTRFDIANLVISKLAE